MKNLRRLLKEIGLVAFVGVSAFAAETALASTVLWYPTPGYEALTEGLPIGNGRLGAMVLGGTADERLALNEDTLWPDRPVVVREAGKTTPMAIMIDQSNGECLEFTARASSTYFLSTH